MAKKIIFSVFLIFVVLTSSVYFLMPDKIKISIENTRTKYYVWENESWTLSATEYVNLYDGTKKMRANNREIIYWNDSNNVYAQRKSIWKDNITTIQTYTFDKYAEKVEDLPIENKLECFNCEGKIVHYEIRDILYEGETMEIESPFSFGHNMKIEWQDGNYYSKVFQQKVASDKIIIKYKPKSNYETYFVRLFDPIETTFNNSLTSENLTFIGNENITRYLSLPKTANVTSAFMNFSGFSSGTSGWNLSAAIYDNVNISSNDPDPTGLFFKPDGLRLYDVGNNLDLIYQSSCSDAWNLSSCTYDSVNISTQDPLPTDLFFKPDGTRLYEVAWTLNLIHQYSCSDAWNLSSCTYDSVNISTQGNNPESIFFKPDGLRLYQSGSVDDLIHQYSCSDAWNLSSCTYDSVNISTLDSEPRSVFFKPDGLRLYESGTDKNKIYQSSCSDAWNLSSCTSDNLNISTQDSDPASIFFKPDGAKLYEIGRVGRLIYEYSLVNSSNLINPFLEAGTPDGSYEWNITGIFNTTNNKTNDFSLSLNTALNDSECDCTGCNLDGNNCIIPFLFHSDTQGILRYSDIQINYTTDQCSPTLNQDFIITDEQICEGVKINIGTGQINITSGNLTLINGANFTAKRLNIQTTGERVFINLGSELRLL